MKTVLGIDLGTQSLKVVFYEYQSKELVFIASSPLEIIRKASGTAEQHAVWWLQALKDCLQQVPESILQSVQAIGVSGQQHGFVPMAKNGTILRPVKLWCDTSTADEVDAIHQACGGIDKAIEYVGGPLVTGYTAPKILWLKNNAPELYDKLHCILLPHDYLNYVLTGMTCMEYGDASGTGLFDIRKRAWSKDMLRAVDGSRDLESCLPPLIASDQFIGKTTELFSNEYGLPSGIPVSTGGGDNMMGAIGTGNVIPGKLTMSLGSSGTVYTRSNTPVADLNGNISGFCSSDGGWLPLICTMNCTLGTELIRGVLGVELSEFDMQLSSVERGSNGVMTLPFFQGERTPNLPYAKGSILGLTANLSKAQLLRSTVEGVTYGLKFGIDQFAELGLKFDEIILTGGGSKSHEWRQIVADICQLPVTTLEQDEGACFGAALQALWVLGLHEKHINEQQAQSLAEIVALHVRCNKQQSASTNPEALEFYRHQYSEYRRLLEHISVLYTH